MKRRSGPSDGFLRVAVCFVFIGSLAWALNVVPAEASLAYVAREGHVDVTVIDTGSGMVVTTLPAMGAPDGVAVTPDGAFVYVGPFGASNSDVVAIDTATNMITASIPVGGLPAKIAATPEGASVYVTLSDVGRVAVIDVATNTLTTTIGAFCFPTGIAITPDGTHAYVANSMACPGPPIKPPSVSVIDTASTTIVADIPLADASVGPNGLAITPDGTRVYAADPGGPPPRVVAIETATNTVVATILTGGDPQNIAITPDGTRAYVTSLRDHAVIVIDVDPLSITRDTVVAVVPVPQPEVPYGVAITPDGTTAWVPTDTTYMLIDTVTNGTMTIPGGCGNCRPLGNIIAITPF